MTFYPSNVSTPPTLFTSVLPPAPDGTAHRAESYAGEDYISIGTFPPGADRQSELAHGVGSTFFDADAADWYLFEKLAFDTTGMDKVTIKQAQKEVKLHLHQMSQSELSTILDEHLVRLREVLAWAGLAATHITRSGYGHHVHLWIARWITCVFRPS